MLAGARGTPPGLRLVQDGPERIVLAHEQPFRIGDAEFRPATREVLHRGEASVIEPRVMQLLVALRRADGSVVSKDDLVALCWEGRIVGEDAINRVVSRARSVAEKQAAGQFRIETITKVGYRLIETKDGAALARIPTELRDEAPTGMRRREVLFGAPALVVIAGAGWLEFGRDKLPAEARSLLNDSRRSLYEGTIEQAAFAIGKLRQATQLAPESAEAWGLLAFAYTFNASLAPAQQRPNLRARGTTAAKRALELEPFQPDALAAQIQAMPEFRNWYSFETACRQALTHHPDHPLLQGLLANVLFQVGRRREALPLSDSVLSKMPLAPRLLTCHIVTLWDLGLFDQAEAAIDRAAALLPGYFGIWFTKLYYLTYNGRAREASAMIADKDSRPHGIPEWNYDLTEQAIDALASDNAAKIRKAIESQEEAARLGTGFAENAAIFTAFVGDLDASFRILNALFFNRGFAMPEIYFSREQGMYSAEERHTYVLFGRPIAAIRRDPRFAILTRELGFNDYWRQTNSRALVMA
jgi:DNA-binding winged helix-turn-helix (wHTH) protein/tetratricopeptide (TPR) repeat protein